MLQRGGIGLLVVATVTLGLVVSAGAAPGNGDIVPDAAQPVAPFTAGIPFASGQTVNVVIPANSVFSPNNHVNIVECAAPNGVPPTTPTNNCDGTTIQGNTILPKSDGSFTYADYQLFALPDSILLGEGSSGVQCGQTAATECILYIGDDQNDFTQPHMWSQPFFIAANASDDGTPAGDGSQPTAATKPDASASTAVAAPASAVADGGDASTVTVTLQDTHSQPFSGKSVSLSATSCTPSPCAATVSGSPAQSDTNGKATFTVTDTVAQAVTLTATDTADSVTLTQTPTIAFQTPTVSPTHSSVEATPTTVPSGGSTTVKVTLRDQGTNPQPVKGHTVTLTATGGATVTPAAPGSDVTDSSGVATFTATDTANELVTFSATDTTSGTQISGSASATFGTLSVSASTSTVTVSSPAPVGATGTTAVVTLLTQGGSPVAGKEVSLQASAGTVQVGAPSPATTGADGTVSFKLTDATAESATLTATDTTDNVALTSKPTVVFEQGTPSASASTVQAAASTSPADGVTQTLITVTVKDQFGHPEQGKTVSLGGTPSGNIQLHPIQVGSATPGVTDASGVAQFEASDSVAESVTISATDTTDSLPLSQTVTIAYQAGQADPASPGTTVAASPANPAADGSTPTTITVTLTDYYSNPVSGKTISLKALNGSANVTTVSPVTNQQGQATFSATDAKAEVVTFQATDVTDSNAVISAEAVVTFGSPPAAPADASFSSVSATPTSVPADGTHTATVTVLLYDANGSPVSGKTVTLTNDAGSAKVAVANGTSDNTGQATFTVSDSATEAVKFTAHDTSDSLDLTAHVVTVTFTAPSTAPGTTTTGAGATVASQSGNSSSFGTTGNSGASLVSTSPTLASTGAPEVLPWLIGAGVLLMIVGTVGRRRHGGKAMDAAEGNGNAA